MNKVITFQDLSKLIDHLKADQIVLVGGCFDILHLGHVRFLKEAHKYGKVLVALESDESVKKYKGHIRPIHKQIERAEVLASLESVNFVITLPYFATHEEYFNLVRTIKPKCIAITEGDPQNANKQKQANEVGAELVVVPKISTPSTTQLATLLKIE